MVGSTIPFPYIDESWKRFLGSDDAPLLLERLGQEQIRHLWRWFESDDGLRSGAILAQEAPVFDLLLDRLCDGLSEEEPNIEEDPFSLPGRLKDPEWALVLFGVGLMFGSGWRSGRNDDLFETSCSLNDLVAYIAREDWVARLRDDRDHLRLNRQNPAKVTRALLVREPLLELPIDALRKLVTGDASSIHWSHELPGEARALFFLGAVAAGIETPRQEEDGERKIIPEGKSSLLN
ncbi:MAG: hypothetical protein VX764_07280 [Planctomycetota bacterium]|nr:hypothetical protein [Planctomycetota bacterium]